jgi:hypothetical protein
MRWHGREEATGRCGIARLKGSQTEGGQDIGSLIVTGEGRRVGMHAVGKVRCALEARPGGFAVSETMVRESARGRPEDSSESPRARMTGRSIRCPASAQGGRLVGAISLHDAANVMIGEPAFHDRLLEREIRERPEGGAR